MFVFLLLFLLFIIIIIFIIHYIYYFFSSTSSFFLSFFSSVLYTASPRPKGLTSDCRQSEHTNDVGTATFDQNMSAFAKLNLKKNETGWGPTSEPDKFTVPYAPFNKSDMIGRAADFTSDNMYYNRRNRAREPGNEAFDYEFDEADANSFNLVDTSKAKKQARLGSSRYKEKQGWRHLRDRDLRIQARKDQAKQANTTRNRRYLRLMQAKRDSRRRKVKDADAPGSSCIC